MGDWVTQRIGDTASWIQCKRWKITARAALKTYTFFKFPLYCSDWDPTRCLSCRKMYRHVTEDETSKGFKASLEQLSDISLLFDAPGSQSLGQLQWMKSSKNRYIILVDLRIVFSFPHIVCLLDPWQHPYPRGIFKGINKNVLHYSELAIRKWSWKLEIRQLQ